MSFGWRSVEWPRGHRTVPVAPAGRHFDGLADAKNERDRCAHCDRSEFPDARIIVLTTYAGDVLCKRAMKAGAQAYILKGNVRKDLLDTTELCVRGKKYSMLKSAAELATHAADDA